MRAGNRTVQILGTGGISRCLEECCPFKTWGGLMLAVVRWPRIPQDMESARLVAESRSCQNAIIRQSPFTALH